MKKLMCFACICFLTACFTNTNFLQSSKTDHSSSRFLFKSKKQLIWPLEGEISSKYGMRDDKFHSGIDIRAKKGANIFAVKEGVIEFSGFIRGYGKTVIIKHTNFRSLYAHCSELFVKAKQKVRQGQTIAKVGSTGKSSGPHLHFEYQNVDGSSSDPESVLP